MSAVLWKFAKRVDRQVGRSSWACKLRLTPAWPTPVLRTVSFQHPRLQNLLFARGICCSWALMTREPLSEGERAGGCLWAKEPLFLFQRGIFYVVALFTIQNRTYWMPGQVKTKWNNNSNNSESHVILICLLGNLEDGVWKVRCLASGRCLQPITYTWNSTSIEVKKKKGNLSCKVHACGKRHCLDTDSDDEGKSNVSATKRHKGTEWTTILRKIAIGFVILHLPPTHASLVFIGSKPESRKKADWT